MEYFDNKFYFDVNRKKKYIVYNDYKCYKQVYNLRQVNKELNLGEQLCDYMNTDFHSEDSFNAFIKKYSITFFFNEYRTGFKEIELTKEELNDNIKQVFAYIDGSFNRFHDGLVSDVLYIYNMSGLVELEELTPYQRFFAMVNSDRFSQAVKFFDKEKTKINFKATEWISGFNFYAREDVTQEIAKKDIVNTPFFYECKDITQALIIELSILAHNNIEIKKCKNCGKFFVPSSRSDELFCDNIFENNKTCKEIGYFKVKQKAIHENEVLRMYRNVYQKLLLRVRRNPDNMDYARDFEFFKDDNIQMRNALERNEITEEKYLEWLKKK